MFSKGTQKYFEKSMEITWIESVMHISGDTKSVFLQHFNKTTQLPEGRVLLCMMWQRLFKREHQNIWRKNWIYNTQKYYAFYISVSYGSAPFIMRLISNLNIKIFTLKNTNKTDFSLRCSSMFKDIAFSPPLLHCCPSSLSSQISLCRVWTPGAHEQNQQWIETC